jgi:FMN phosphatase YigB (HAD superfamily)
MSLSLKHRVVLAALSLTLISFAPAAPADQNRLTSLAEARLQAALKQYQETWAYYQQARIDSYQVYVWSKLILDCRREMTDDPARQLTALEDHLDRMKKLEALVKKVRRLGFGLSFDVGASEYYRLEAEFWLARETRGK